MIGCMLGSGKIIKCTEKGCLVGLMEGGMKGSMLMIRKKAGEYLFGRMEGSMKGIGLRGSSTEGGNILMIDRK